MRIAFISYEYPPDTADGGIATYVQQAARMLQGRGHDIEVFAASRHRTQTTRAAGLTVHRIHLLQKEDFSDAVAPLFAQRHAASPFDVLEGPDYNADAREAVRRVPDIPLVVRLHTPRYLATALNALSRVAHTAANGKGDLFQGAWSLPEGYAPSRDPEYLHARQADEITAPSLAIGDRVSRDWLLDRAKVVPIPNIYQPDPALLELPAPEETHSQTVVFVGRLEGRKGVLDFAAAIPPILARCPRARFRFVGRPLDSPEPGLDMQQYLQRRLQPVETAVEFAGPVALTAIPAVLGAAAVCVFPSLWENFPCVCLEAMAAARGIVGSRAGGMAELLEGGRGLLVPPQSPDAIAEAVSALLNDPHERARMGQAARQRLLTDYSAAQIAPQQEASYHRAIQRRRQAPRRRVP